MHKRLENQADLELDLINATSSSNIALLVSSSNAIVNWIVSLMYKTTGYCTFLSYNVPRLCSCVVEMTVSWRELKQISNKKGKFIYTFIKWWTLFFCSVLVNSSLKTEWFTSIEFPLKNEPEKAYLHVYERMTLRFSIHERALNTIQVNMNILCWDTNREKVKKTCEEIRRRKPDVTYFLSSWSLNLATKPSCFL